jgi:hypothetical protein
MVITLANDARQVCTDSQKTTDAIIVGIENIAGLIHRCALYENYLGEGSDASKNLQSSMLRLYIAILKFLAKAIDKSKSKHSHPTGCCPS